MIDEMSSSIINRIVFACIEWLLQEVCSVTDSAICMHLGTVAASRTCFA